MLNLDLSGFVIIKGSRVKTLIFYWSIHAPSKNFSIFLSSAGMSLTKVSLSGNNFMISAQGDFGKLVIDIPTADWGREYR